MLSISSIRDMTDERGRHIAAPLDIVWQLHTDIGAWPTWNGDVVSASLEGPLAPRSIFSVTTSAATWRARIYACIEGQEIFWGNVADEDARWLQHWIFVETIHGVQVTATATGMGGELAVAVDGMAGPHECVDAWLDQLQAAAVALASSAIDSAAP
jgi:uncharacterized membrane protein